ncbi:MAG: ABC-2 family transporter protein [Acidobacteria bacterium]|nr:ABC-2 family transporter protein [Acidobacteriota bacterium]
MRLSAQSRRGDFHTPLSPPALLRSVVPYVGFARIAFLQILAYRLRYFTGILTYLVNVTVYYFIWKALYRTGGAIQGFSFRQMITYVAVGWIIRTFYFNNVDREMANDIQQGHIAGKLTRPVNYQWMHISQAAGEALFRIMMFTFPSAAVILLVYPVDPPASATAFGAFLLSLVFSFLIFSSLNFLIGTCAVYLHSILGLIRAKYFLVEILSGLIIPINFFPEAFVRVSQWLPFQHISYTPLMIYMGKMTGAELGSALLLESAWGAALLLAGHRFWRRASGKLIVQGG